MSKPSILFVDDDPNILSGLRRMLHRKRIEWDFSFAPDSEQAQELLKRQKFDVIISDMRMPKIDGAQLLSFVERTSPETVRIVLSGYSEEAAILRTVGPAHRYLAKPCDAETLTALIEDAVALRTSPDAGSLLTEISSLRHMPTPPELYRRLVAEINSPAGSVASVAEIIALDVAMTAGILKLTNSSFFGIAGPVSSPLQSMRMLGFTTVKTLVLSEELFHPFSGPPHLASLLDRLDAYGRNLAALACRIALDLGAGVLEQEQAFSAGMLSQIGPLILLGLRPDDFVAIASRVSNEHDLLKAEHTAFHTNQATLGGYLLGLWGFPLPIRRAVTHQFTPSKAKEADIVLTALHAALACGPPCPLLETGQQTCMLTLDSDYFTTNRIANRPEAWRRLAAITNAEKKGEEEL